MNGVDLDKLKELVLLLARHGSVKNLGVTKLAKLVYYIDAEALRTTGDSITGSEFIKHERGPVPSRMDRALKQLQRADAIRVDALDFFEHKLHRIDALREPDWSRFSAEELAIIDRVAGKLGSMTADDLGSTA